MVGALTGIAAALGAAFYAADKAPAIAQGVKNTVNTLASGRQTYNSDRNTATGRAFAAPLGTAA